MNRFALSSAILAVCLLAAPVSAQEAAPAAADTFEREALKLLKASHESKRGVNIHVNGRSVAGVVKAIGPDAVVLSNREYSTIVVRRERIDAIEAN